MEKNFSKSKSISSREIIIEFLKKDKLLYKDVEIVIHCICVGAVKVSVESVVETLVSRYEQHFTPQRQDTDESSAMEEMNIAENGPHLQHADSVIEDSMNSYWKDHDKKLETGISLGDQTIYDHTLGKSE